MLQHRKVLANYEIDHLPHAVNKTQQTQKYQLRAAPVFLVVCHTHYTYSVTPYTAVLSAQCWLEKLWPPHLWKCSMSCWTGLAGTQCSQRCPWPPPPWQPVPMSCHPLWEEICTQQGETDPQKRMQDKKCSFCIKVKGLAEQYIWICCECSWADWGQYQQVQAAQGLESGRAGLQKQEANTWN